MNQESLYLKLYSPTKIQQAAWIRSLLAAYFVLVSCLALSSTLKMEAVYSSGTLITFIGLHVINPRRQNC
jgi:hypothetical protein